MTTLIPTIENSRSNDFAGLLERRDASFGTPAFDFPSDDFSSRTDSRNREYNNRLDAFYRIRYAIAAIQPIDKSSITPGTPLETFFPRKGRSQRVKAFQYELGIEVNLLAMTDACEWAILLGAATSLGAVFFSWKAAIACLSLTIVIGVLAAKFGKQLQFGSVSELTEKLVREHYA